MNYGRMNTPEFDNSTEGDILSVVRAKVGPHPEKEWQDGMHTRCVHHQASRSRRNPGDLPF